MPEHPIANVEMAAAWDGDEGAGWAANAEHYDAAAARYNPHLVEQLSPDDDVLDIGCGNGSSTRDAARVARSALGIDLSSQMLANARKRAEAEGLSNVRFEQGDAQVHSFTPESFDIAISRFGAMFFGDPVAAFANIARGLRSGGRIAVLGWQGLAENDWLRVVREALAMGRDLPLPPLGEPGPFGLADPDNNRRILTEAGYENIANEDITEPVHLGADLDDAYAFLSSTAPVRGMLADLSEEDRARGLDSLREVLAERDTSEGVLVGSRAWLVTARKP